MDRKPNIDARQVSSARLCFTVNGMVGEYEYVYFLVGYC